MGELAVALDHVLDGRRLHEEGVVAAALHHALHALHVAGGEGGRALRLHEGPHALVRGEVGVLEGEWAKVEVGSHLKIVP